MSTSSGVKFGPVNLAPGYTRWNARTYLFAAFITIGMLAFVSFIQPYLLNANLKVPAGEQGRALGMDGKTLIHPGQITVCNELFSPAPEEVAWSRKIIAAFKLPENAAKGVITVEGRMVERLHLAMAQRVADIAEAIATP